MGICLDYLESKRLLIDEQTDALDEQDNVLSRMAFCICTKSDIAKEGAGEKVKQLCSDRFEIIQISAQTAEAVEELREKFFKLLNIVRIYSKKPGKKPDMSDPFTLPAGSNVMDLARAIHRQLAEKLKSARIWGTGVHPGQNVQRNHILMDRDIIELHFS